MFAELTIRSLHFIGIMLFFGTVLAAHLQTRPKIRRSEARRIAVLDFIAALSGTLTVAMGLLLWLSVGKPKAFYSANPLFHVKLTLLVFVVFLAIRCAWFWRWQRRGEPDDLITVPGSIRMVQRAQLFLLLACAVMGSLVARGLGLPSS